MQDLAEYLFNLREHRLALTGEESDQIINLWQALGEFDKKKTTYSPRHQTNLKQGRFRASKKNVAPGVESTRRYAKFSKYRVLICLRVLIFIKRYIFSKT